MAEWQPISTAPKDGTPFLASVLRGKNRYSTVLSYDRILWWIWRKGYRFRATHWMPLPDPPIDANG